MKAVISKILVFVKKVWLTKSICLIKIYPAKNYYLISINRLSRFTNQEIW